MDPHFPFDPNPRAPGARHLAHRSVWARARQSWSPFASLAAVILFTLTIGAIFAYLQILDGRHAREILLRDMQATVRNFRSRLNADTAQLADLARALSNPQTTPQAFSDRATALLDHNAALRWLVWLDASETAIASQAQPGLSTAHILTQAENIVQEQQGIAAAGHLSYRLIPASSDSDGPLLGMAVPVQTAAKSATLIGAWSVEDLMNDEIPTSIKTEYATSMTDRSGLWLAGAPLTSTALKDTPAYWLSTHPIGATTTLKSLPDNILQLHFQTWGTPGNAANRQLFWLILAISVITFGLLLINWRQSKEDSLSRRALLAETGFRRAMENSMLTGMRALDLDGRITYVNPAFCRMTGWDEADLIGQTQPFSYWPKEDYAHLTARLQRELGGLADPGGSHTRIQRKDGTQFDARIYVSPLMDAHDVQTGWMASMTDITEHDRARRQLSEAHDRFTTVLQGLDASISVTALGSSELLFANKRYRQWFGNDSRGHLQLLLRGGSSTSTASDQSVELDSPRLPPRNQIEIHEEKLDKWFEVRARYLNWVDGRLAQMVIATDISTRRRAERMAAEQAERAEAASRLITMGEMASSVAHEINQPLTAINNYCNGMLARLRRNSLTREELLDALEKTAHQAGRAGQVVQHIRSFVKRSEPRCQTVSVPALVQRVSELLEPDLTRYRIHWQAHVDTAVTTIHADPILIEQVLINLVRNGADAVREARRGFDNRHVSLVVTSDETNMIDGVKFEITDSGTGLPAAGIEHLYDAFYSTKSEGMGIGLNLCRSIVEAHQGRIQAKNLYNQGSIGGCKFDFWIPIGGPVFHGIKA